MRPECAWLQAPIQQPPSTQRGGKGQPADRTFIDTGTPTPAPRLPSTIAAPTPHTHSDARLFLLRL